MSSPAAVLEMIVWKFKVSTEANELEDQSEVIKQHRGGNVPG